MRSTAFYVVRSYNVNKRLFLQITSETIKRLISLVALPKFVKLQWERKLWNLKCYLAKYQNVLSCGKSSFCTWINDNKQILFQKILQPYTHILKTSTKGFRTKTFQAFNYWLNLPADKLSEVQEVLKMYHLTGLL